MAEHTVLVAFTVDAATRQAAQHHLLEQLADADLVTYGTTAGITSWWEAEDDRADGSDNDSAVFVRPGLQSRALFWLNAYGFTPDCNLQPATRGNRFGKGAGDE